MKSLAISLSRLFAVGFLAMAFVAGTPSMRAATVTNPAASTVSDQVRHQLLMLPWYGVFDQLQYQVNGSEVVLSGQLTGEHAVTKNDAEKVVRRIPGVTTVVNRIEILPASMFDNQIRRAEYRTIFSKSDLGRYTLGTIPQVRIIVKNGHVTLEGSVMNQMDKNIAGIAANSVSGVFSVTNDLQIEKN